MTIQNRNTTPTVGLKEAVFASTSERGSDVKFNDTACNIARGAQEAWLPSPFVHRVMSNALQVQKSVEMSFASSSAHIEKMMIAFEVLGDRNFQNASDSKLLLRATGRGLGGSGRGRGVDLAQKLKEEKAALKQKLKEGEKRLSVCEKQFEKLDKDYSKAISKGDELAASMININRNNANLARITARIDVDAVKSELKQLNQAGPSGI